MHQTFAFIKNKIVIIVLFCVLLLTGFSASSVLASHPPTDEEITFAKETTDLLQAELFAALLQEFSETTPDNVEQGKLAISLVFDDCHTNFRLVGKDQPLSQNDLPMDRFERRALRKALQGEPFEKVGRVKGEFFYRRSVPLANFDPSCVLCHTNFGAVDPNQYVGMLTLKVPTTNPLM